MCRKGEHDVGDYGDACSPVLAASVFCTVLYLSAQSNTIIHHVYISQTFVEVFWVHKKVFGDWWLSWPCGIGHHIVWAQKHVFWEHPKVFGYWWLSWPCGIGQNIVWAQKHVSWIHKNVIRDWWLSWPCGIGHHIVWAQKHVCCAHKKEFGYW